MSFCSRTTPVRQGNTNPWPIGSLSESFEYFEELDQAVPFIRHCGRSSPRCSAIVGAARGSERYLTTLL